MAILCWAAKNSLRGTVEDREEWVLKNIAYSTAPSSHNSANANQGTHKSYERKEAKVMAVKAIGKGEPHFPPPKKWSPDHPWGRPCIVGECREEHAPTSCALFKNKTPEDRLQLSNQGSCVYSASGTWIRRGVGPWARWIIAVSEGVQGPTMHCCMMSSRTRK
jgi:hypothetical protein